MDAPYLELSGRCVKLDARHTRYRFDLENDVPWHDTSAAGLYYSPALLNDLGVDVAGLSASADAMATFQWAAALATCIEFIELERGILDFVDREREALGPVRSTELLYEEEEKHIALFVRYADALRGQRPELVGPLERLVHATRGAPFDDRARYPDAASYHFGFWLSTLFFEDYTIYLHERLAEAAGEVQPAWLAAHAMHRREEEQHVVTDVAHIEACTLDDAGRARFSRLAYVWLTDNLGRFTALDAPERLVRERFGELALAPRARFADTRLHADVLEHKLFRRTRAAWPYLGELAQPDRDPAPAPGQDRPKKRLSLGSLRTLGQSAQSMLRELADRAQKAAPSDIESFDLRKGLAAPLVDVPPIANEPSPPTSHLEAVRAVWSEILERPADTIGDDDSFVALGGDSLQAVEILTRLESHLGRALPADLLLECRTVGEFAAFLGRQPARLADRGARTRATTATVREPIAIVAMTARVPGADDLDRLWRLIEAGAHSTRPVPPARWSAADHHDADPRAPGKTVCTSGCFLDDIGDHDAAALGLTPEAAHLTDPQQRLFLEIVGDLLERAGGARGATGVFASAGRGDYYQLVAADPAQLGGAAVLGNLDNMIAARVAQAFALTGPALTVDAACASSHLAVHLACRSLHAGECELAIAGAAQLNLGPAPFIAFSQAGVLSPSQRCRPFSAAADGFVPGDGAGAVLLAPLSVARARGLEVLATIRGSAVNNDGGALSGMAPSPEGQVEVLRRAWSDAGLDPATVDLIEAHGTGTSIGDAVEAQALAHVFGDARPGLTSVKSNLGHTFTAAGVASVIKVVLAMRARTLPPLAGFEAPDPRIDFERLGLEPIARARPWPATSGRPRRAGITGLGIGGTNVHLVLEEVAPEPAPERTQRDAALVCIAAPTAADVDRVAAVYADRVAASTNPDAELAAINRRAWRFRHRRAVVAPAAELAAAMRAPGPVHVASARPRTVLVFSGPGSQFTGMARPLYEGAPAFRDALERCGRILSGHLPRSLASYLYRDHDATPAMDRIEVTQPLVFSIGYSLGVWLSSLGVTPDAVIGHSAGEYIAACVAGGVELEQALALVARRGACMSRTPAGGMAAVFAGEDRVRALCAIGDGVDFAAVNDPTQVVLSGASAALDRALATLDGAGVASHRLPISCAAHSPLMASAQAELAPFARAAELAPLATALYSTARDQRFAPGTTLDADYWIEHLRAPVRFARAIERAAADGAGVFLEVGASGGLVPCIESTLEASGHRAAVVPLLARARAGSWAPALEALGRLWELGVPVDGRALDPGPAAPTAYPYARRRHWIDRDAVAPTPAAPRPPTPSRPAHVRDHVARGTAIAPGAMLMERALDGAGDGVALTDVITARPYDGGSSLTVQRDGDRVTVDSGAGTHLSARLEPANAVDGFDLEVARARCQRELPVDRLYRLLSRTGMRYGPTIATVRALWLGDHELVARLEADPDDPGEGRRFHPGVVDGAMQAIGGFAAAAGDDDAPRPTYLGFSVAQLTAPRPVPNRAWAHVRVHGDVLAGAAAITADVTIASDDGQVCARLARVGLKRVDPPPRPRGAIETVLLVGGDAGVRRELEDRGVFVIERPAPRDAGEAAALLARLGPVDAVAGGEPTLWARLPHAPPMLEAARAAEATATAGAGAFLRAQVAAARALAVDAVDPRASFAELGVDSLTAVDLVRRLERRYRTRLYPTLLFEYPTIERAAAALADRFGITEEPA